MKGNVPVADSEDFVFHLHAEFHDWGKELNFIDRRVYLISLFLPQSEDICLP